MNFDLKSYVKIYPNWVDDDICEKVIDSLKESKWEKHSYHIERERREITFDTDLFISQGLPQWTEPMHNKIWHAIEQYIVKDFCFPWNNSWSGFTQIRYNKYDVGTEMRTHCDHIQTIFDGTRRGIPILSVLGSLNNDYEGGELVMWEQEVIELKAGDIMIFPSNFLYPHKITPVTKGTRYSYVSWVW